MASRGGAAGSGSTTLPGGDGGWVYGGGGGGEMGKGMVFGRGEVKDLMSCDLEGAVGLEAE